MKKIFLSYRREDTQAIAGRIYDKLEARWGEDCIFFDVDNIPLGADFRVHITNILRECGVVLVLIGPKWLEATKDGKRRIESSNDPVHMEINIALMEEIPIIPVLVDQTKMPMEAELPPSISSLSFRNGIRLDSGIDFKVHLNRLILGIVKQIETKSKPDSMENSNIWQNATTAEHPIQESIQPTQITNKPPHEDRVNILFERAKDFLHLLLEVQLGKV